MARHGFVPNAADGVRRGKSAGGYGAALLKVRDVHEEVTTADAESGVCIAACGAPLGFAWGTPARQTTCKTNNA